MAGRKDAQRGELAQGPAVALGMRRALLLVLSLFVLQFAVASGAQASSSFPWYWYNGNNENCWQTGQLGSEGHACDFVFANYLPGHMSNGGFGQDLNLTSNGDYCAYFGAGDELNSPIASSQGAATGLTTPEPFSSYQEGDANTSVCQANAHHWGQEMRSGVPGGLCGTGNGAKSCGMEHYAVLNHQSTLQRPWSSAFNQPSFVLSAHAGMQTFSTIGNEYGGWAFACPEFEDTNSHGVIEYCFEEWRSPHNAPLWTGEHFQECNNPWSEIVTMFYPGTQYAEEVTGSSNTLVGTGGFPHFEARITPANMANAARLVNSRCTGWHLSENAADYALIGVEQGMEGWDGVSEMAGSEENLQLSTQYTPKPPAVSTGAATNLLEEQATLKGSVNPEWTDTHYRFEYGETTSYGSSTPEVDAGSGSGSVGEQASIANLQPGMTYHYRLRASNAGGTSYGADQTFITPAPSSAIAEVGNPGTQFIASEGTNHALYVTIYSNGTWQGPYAETPPNTVYSAPAAIADNVGNIFWTFEGPNHTLQAVVRIAETPGHPAKVEPAFPLVGEGSTYSAPAAIADNFGNIFWTYQGPNHTLRMLVRIAETKEHPAKLEPAFSADGEGTTYSAPAAIADNFGNIFWTYQGPNHTLRMLVRIAETKEHPAKLEPAFSADGEGTTYSVPGASTDNFGDIFWTYQGPSRTFRVLVRIQETKEHPAKLEKAFQQLGPETTFSAISGSTDPNGVAYWAYQGPNHNLQVFVRTPETPGHPAELTGPWQEAAPGTTYAGPVTTPLDATGNFFWSFPSSLQALEVTKRTASGEVKPPQQLGEAGTDD